jgi:hypothetical protein
MVRIYPPIYRECKVCGVTFLVPRSNLDAGCCGAVCGNASRRIPANERFVTYVSTVPTESGCLEWLGATSSHGYGVFGPKHGDAMQAHRYAWFLHTGEWPPAEAPHVLHRCDNRRCVNVAHLFLGTNEDNIRDKIAKGRSAMGELAGKAKLTNVLVREMRRRFDAGEINQVDAAREYGVSFATSHNVLRHKTWKHVA